MQLSSVARTESLYSNCKLSAMKFTIRAAVRLLPPLSWLSYRRRPLTSIKLLSSECPCFFGFMWSTCTDEAFKLGRLYQRNCDTMFEEFKVLEGEAPVFRQRLLEVGGLYARPYLYANRLRTESM